MSNSEDEIMIQSTTKKKVKLSETENIDRLSDLHDCIILHILSFLNTKDAVRTCVLSTRWKDLWKHIHALILHSPDFRTLKIFANFVSRVLSLRDSSIELHTLDFRRRGCIEPHLLKKIVNYAISHNVQRLGLSLKCKIEQIPHTIFSCQSLTYLKLSVYHNMCEETPFPKSINLPALTTLHLEYFAFCAYDNDYVEPFLALNRLNRLVLYNCIVSDRKILRVSSVTLVNLTIYMTHSKVFYKIELCTPSLCTFAFTGTPMWYFSKDSFSSIKHVDIDADLFLIYDMPPMILLSWLIYLSNVKSLTVSTTTLQVLSLYPDILNIKLRILGNLKSLKVKTKPLEYGFRMSLWEAKLKEIRTKKEAARLERAFAEGSEPSSLIPDGIVDFLIQNAPSAKVEIIDCSW